MTSGVNLNHFQMEHTLDRLPELFHFFTMEIRDYLFEDRLSELFHLLVGDFTTENTHIAMDFPLFLKISRNLFCQLVIMQQSYISYNDSISCTVCIKFPLKLILQIYC